MSTPQSLHQTYQRETGMELALTIPRIDLWTLFSKRFTEDDLVLVLRHLKRGISKQERRIGCLKLSNLLFDLDLFEEDLGIAKAAQRNFKPEPTPKEKVIAQLRPVVSQTHTTTTPARPVSELIGALKTSAGMSV